MSKVIEKLKEVKKALAGATAAIVLLQAADQSVVPRTVLGAALTLVAAIGAFIAVYVPENAEAK